MSNDEFYINEINGVPTVLKGIGKMYYQMGFPILMAIEHFKEQGYNVSYLHIADELYKHGWQERAIINAFLEYGKSEDFDIEKIKKFILVGKTTVLLPDTRDKSRLKRGEEFIYSSGGYEAQREMLFKSLFGFL